MIISESFDVECFINLFSVIFVDLKDYLQKFADCVDDKGNPIPMTEKLSVAEIEKRLSEVKSHTFYISDTDDSQLLELVSYINQMQAIYETKTSPEGEVYQVPIRHDLFGFNSSGYDDLMIKAFLMYYNRFDKKYLCEKLKEVSDKIIKLQSDKTAFYEDKELEMIRKYRLPYASVDVQKVYGLHSAGVNVDKDTGERQKFGKGLKQTSINLKWYNLLDFNLPPITEEENDAYYRKDIMKYHNYTAKQLNSLITNDFDRYVMPQYVKPMLDYNINDVFIVCEMVRLKPDEVKLRYSITSAFDTNVLCSARANIADKLTVKFYSKMSGLHKDKFIKLRTERSRMSFNKIIFPHIKFKTKELQDLLDYMKTVYVYHTTTANKTIPMRKLNENLSVSNMPGVFKAEINFHGTKYTLAAGGLHSQDNPNILISDDDFVYVHFDFNSYYPSIVISYDICPKHLVKKIFVDLVRYLRDTRVKCKHTSDSEGFVIEGVPNKIAAEALKIVINSIYGKFGSELFFLYDNIAKLQVTINGQLMTMTLVEELELNGIHVVSANTDGIVIKLPRDKKKVFDDITKRWNEFNKMGADSEYYKALYVRDVNNYFAIWDNDKVEFHGALDPKQYLKDLTKGYDMPVVAIAVYNYFRYNKPVMQTLKEHTDILDFCKTQNVGKQFDVVYDKIENGEVKTINSQTHVRFYVSTKGVVIQKQERTTGKKQRLASGLPVQILNRLDDLPIEERNINYKYYYDEAYKIIDPIKLSISPNQKGNKNNKSLSGKVLIKKYSQQYLTLFDDE